MTQNPLTRLIEEKEEWKERLSALFIICSSKIDEDTISKTMGAELKFARKELLLSLKKEAEKMEKENETKSDDFALGYDEALDQIISLINQQIES